MNIIKASLEHLSIAAPLFNSYRMFYQQESDLKRAHEFLSARIKNNESTIFLALDENNGEKAVGFMQIYPGFSSVSMKKTLILNDLYIIEESRGKGVGRLLMKAAKAFAKECGVSTIILQTAEDNLIGQALYKSEGYVVDDDYLTMVLTLK